MNNGFVVIWRKIIETSFFKDAVALQLAIYLILKASHEDQTITFNGQPLIIHRGQLITGRDKLATALDASPSTIRNKLVLLRNARFLDSETNNKFTIITICNYDTYQNNITKLGQQLGQPEDSQRTHTTIKQLNNLLNGDSVNGICDKYTITNDNKVFNNDNGNKLLYLEKVLLTKDEYTKLIDKFGKQDTEDRIARLNGYGHQFPKKFKQYGSHYHTILAWARKDEVSKPKRMNAL